MTKAKCKDFSHHIFSKFRNIGGKKSFYCEVCGTDFRPLRLPRDQQIGRWWVEFSGKLIDGDRIYWPNGDSDTIIANPGNLIFREVHSEVGESASQTA